MAQQIRCSLLLVINRLAGRFQQQQCSKLYGYHNDYHRQSRTNRRQSFVAQIHPSWTEFTCTNRAIFRLGKLVPHWDDNAESAEYKYCDEVDELRDKATVEAVVQPRYKRAHRQQRNTAVVKSVTAAAMTTHLMLLIQNNPGELAHKQNSNVGNKKLVL